MTFAGSVMLRLFPLLALLSMAVPAVSSPPQQGPPQPSFNEIVQRADSARTADRVTEAIRLYRQAVQLRPSWSDGWLWLGDLLYEQDRFPEAQDSFAHFLAIKPAPGPAWAMKALCEFEMRDYAHSSEDFETWMHAGNQGNEALTDVADFHAALLLTRERHFDQALSMLTEKAQRSGESPLLIEAMGLASLRMPNLPGDYPPGLREQVWLAGKATFYLAVQEFERGQAYSSRLLANYGQQPQVHYIHGLLLKAQSKSDQASQAFRAELQISPKNSQAMLELAQIDIGHGKLQEAMSLSHQAVQIDSTNPEAHYVLGQGLLAAGQTKASVQELESAERLAPNNAAIHFHLATAYQRLGRKEDAQREMSTYSVLKKKWPAQNEPVKMRDSSHSPEAPQ
jgi:tetratricopeptide (TPR) repeat protein